MTATARAGAQASNSLAKDHVATPYETTLARTFLALCAGIQADPAMAAEKGE